MGCLISDPHPGIYRFRLKDKTTDDRLNTSIGFGFTNAIIDEKLGTGTFYRVDISTSESLYTISGHLRSIMGDGRNMSYFLKIDDKMMEALKSETKITTVKYTDDHDIEHIYRDVVDVTGLLKDTLTNNLFCGYLEGPGGGVHMEPYFFRMGVHDKYKGTARDPSLVKLILVDHESLQNDSIVPQKKTESYRKTKCRQCSEPFFRGR